MTHNTAQSPTLHWSLKTSFLHYLEGRLSDGEVAVSGGAERRPDGSFAFPLCSDLGAEAVPAADGVAAYEQLTRLQFAGTVHCTGHRGLLALLFADPAIELIDGRLLLTIAEEELPGGRLGLLELPGVDLTDSEPRGTDTADRPVTVHVTTPILTRDGADLFFGNYRPGEVFDPVTITGLTANQAQQLSAARPRTSRPAVELPAVPTPNLTAGARS